MRQVSATASDRKEPRHDNHRDPASGPGEDERGDALADRLLTSVIESMELASV
jgi:hypothetical protein